jgi:hypothetical protein
MLRRMNSSAKVIVAPPITDQIGLAVMLCLTAAVHGPIGDLLARQAGGLPRLMAGSLYLFSGLGSVLTVMAMLAVASMVLAQRGQPHEHPAESMPADLDLDPEAWHPKSDQES